MQFRFGRTWNVNNGGWQFLNGQSLPLDAKNTAINAELPAAILHFAQAGKIGLKNGTLLAVAIPAMGGAALPAVQDWFMLKVVIAPAKHSGLLAPDQACSQLELRGHKSAAKHHAIASLGVGHINRAARAQAVMHDLERGKKKILKFLRGHFIVFDLASLATVINIVRRICPDHVQFLPIQQPPCIRRACRIAAHEPVPAQ